MNDDALFKTLLFNFLETWNAQNFSKTYFDKTSGSGDASLQTIVYND
jgi:hypothetical protein